MSVTHVMRGLTVTSVTRPSPQSISTPFLSSLISLSFHPLGPVTRHHKHSIIPSEAQILSWLIMCEHYLHITQSGGMKSISADYYSFYFDFYAVYFCIWTFYKHTGVKKCKLKLHLVTQRRSFWEIYKISLEQIWGILWSFSLFMCLCYSACCGGPVWTQDAWTLGSISLN